MPWRCSVPKSVRRMKLYGDRQVESLKRWNREHPDQRMPYLVVVVDESAEVTSKGTGDREEQQQRRRAVHAISQIARLGRAVGILRSPSAPSDLTPRSSRARRSPTWGPRWPSGRATRSSPRSCSVGRCDRQPDPGGHPRTRHLEMDRFGHSGPDAASRGRPGGSRPARRRQANAGRRDFARRPPEMWRSSRAGRKSAMSRGCAQSQMNASLPGTAPPMCSATFDVTRLAVGRRYEFTLTDGRTVVGVLRALEVPNLGRRRAGDVGVRPVGRPPPRSSPGRISSAEFGQRLISDQASRPSKRISHPRAPVCL